jgi:nitroimidazol reductase NimA-like FMN-containing flavoprotein (pyridoxamine 5'-phosphate oxidase superfamily)
MPELGSDEIAEVLANNGLGVLALDGGAAPYPIPVAFGYDPDDDTFVVQLEGEGGYKQQCLSHNPNVGFTVYEEREPSSVWYSVVLRGRLTETSYQEAETAFAALASNTHGAPNPVVWGEAEGEVTPYELLIEQRTGHKFVID